MKERSPAVGPSGAIARVFQDSKLTPLLAGIAILLDLVIILITPKEEEPQIDVTMVDIMVAFPGAGVSEVESLIATPAEQVLSEISGIEHVYSVSRPGQAVITLEYEVGLPRQEALVRTYNQVYSNQDWLPPDLGTRQPLVKPRGIDDVPVMTLTLFDPEERHGAEELTRLAHLLEVALKRIPGTRDVYTLGGIADRVEVRLDPARMNGVGLTLDDLQQALAAANTSSRETRVTRDGLSLPLQAGTLLAEVADVRQLVVGIHDGAAIRLSDVATIERGGTVPDQSVMMGFGPAEETDRLDLSPGHLYPAVTLAIAKKAGQNAIDITTAIETRLEALTNRLLPPDIEVVVTRDYGKTATDKSRTLIRDLVTATMAVMLLVLAAMGWRQALIVGTAVLITLLLTLVFSWAWGFTLNRVSLFALIFSIGILVDDGIVITENINRRLANSRGSARRIIPMAVDEVGTPTIMASLTIMAALLPMAFVSGLMGPYMRPIPINASAGMVISQLVAFVVAPWLAMRLLAKKRGTKGQDTTHQYAKDEDATEEDTEDQETSADGHSAEGVNPRIKRLFERLLGPFLGKHPWRRRLLGLALLGLLLGAMSLPVFQLVILKMLPFDNKSELQVVVDMPEHTPMEQTQRVLLDMGRHLESVPEIDHWQSYAGTASPINFNGLVRQYYLREAPYQGDIQINLADKQARSRSSHAIALALRDPLQAIGERHDARVKIVEVPPGPPVLSPVVAEVYAVTPDRRAALARRVAEQMHEVQGLVDIDTTLHAPTRKWEVVIDRDRAARLGVSQAQVVMALQTSLEGSAASYLHDDHAKYPVPIRLILDEGDKAQPARLLSLAVRSREGGRVPLASIAEIQEVDWEGMRYHKDLLPVTYVTADMAGEIDSPLYGMFRMVERLSDQESAPQQTFIHQPVLPERASLKWDGEWQITYETFRDMGLAYSVGVFMIFVLLVAQFRSYSLPLLVMAPIPLTLIGIMPGHALLDKEFTATSMIGMIALAGIIVRNSILLVVFIRQLRDEGVALDDAVVLAGAVRLKPIALTAVSAMLGAFFILADPIFNGLAISLVFGLAASTLLTLLVVPLLYYVKEQAGESRAPL
ncbi:MAG: efflux RND transporter permease subunit [Halomonas sp.]|uniref:efflux RND transporter permease subunit n=1 Tax=Halomonas sp. TaxID=1486246 RepID=UPI002ACD4E4E|nr:efflux RND transporter permease subunit [Halomonas sp.]MDZ7851247.1 efflux RND transporter permease subunit [Halomonas sp.]